MKKRVLSLVLAVILIVGLLPTAAFASTNGKTADDAINWVRSLNGQPVGSGECVALIKAYYSYLGQTSPGGNGADYSWNQLPAGWKRIPNEQPQKGDILVYSGNAANPYGHVAIYESDYSTWHQNFASQRKVVHVTNIRYNGFDNPYWGVIRPDFSSATKTETIPAGSCPSAGFTDVPGEGNWAHAGIDYCVANGLMSGVGDNLFAPKMTTTRAQIVQILYNLEGEPKVSGTMPFTDLTQNWYKDAVLWAYQTGVTSGVSETTFAPDTPVTREQVAVFLARFADRVLDRYTPYMWDALFPFQDREQISYYARTAMNWACDLGLIKGIPGPGGLRLEPQSSATREQMAVMIARFCRRLNVWNEPMPEL